MPFDPTTRNRLATFVREARTVIADEFTQQFQALYGISPSGGITPLEQLTHLDEAGRATAALLRERIDYLIGSYPSEKNAAAAAVSRLAREQSFTILNRLAAIRMAEKRKLIVESVGKGYQSAGFRVYESVAGTGLGDAFHRYRFYLFCLFDELAVDLGILFDRRSASGLLFPRETALLRLLELLNAHHIEELWAEDETIGWIYQYFNDEAERSQMRKDSAAPRNSRELAVRNQFFTPRYVVEFLTDNTLGCLWYEMTRGTTILRERCCHLVRRPTEIFLNPGQPAPESTADSEAKTGEILSQEELLQQPVHIPHRPLKDPREIRLLDPACGSMHFGLYAFDLFTVIYDEAWEIAHGPDEAAKSEESFAPFVAFAKAFPDKAAFLLEVPRLIVESNIHGIDIDPRAAQIARLSLWLRAQRAWHDDGVKPADRPRITRSNIVCAEPMPGERELLREFVEQQFPAGERPAFAFLLGKIFDCMTLAGEAGSLLPIEEEIRAAIAAAKRIWKEGPKHEQASLFSAATEKQGEMRLDLSGITDEQFWVRAEQRIYEALETYSEQAENEGGFQRRLFADDAAQGFAFIDLCRKRYDVAVMNPPFGSFSKPWIPQSKIAYPNSSNDILGAFVERFLHRLHPGGRLGAITSRTCFFLTSFKDWRLNVVLGESAIRVIADLGQGVMDNAMVEAAAYVLEKTRPTSRTTVFRAIADADRQAALEACIEAHQNAHAEERLFLADQATFHLLPGSPFVYWIGGETIRQFKTGKTFEPDCGSVRQGLATGDDPRYVRAVWEVAPEDTIFCYYPANGESFCRFDDPIVQEYFRRREKGTPQWAFHVKSGASQPWYSPVTLKINWAQDGEELKNFKNEKGKLRSRPQNLIYFYRPGFSWTRRAVRFYPYAIPGNCVPSVSRYMAFPDHGMQAQALGVCSSRLVSSFLRFYAEFWQRPNFLVDTLKQLPWPELPAEAKAHFEKLIAREVEQRRLAYQNHEPFHEFLLPVKIRDFSQAGQALAFDPAALLDTSTERMVAEAFGFSEEQARTVERDLLEAIDYQRGSAPASTEDASAEPPAEGDEEDEGDDDSDFVLDYSPAAIEEAHISYLVGCVFGRWDIRYATGEKQPPTLPHPFAPLPVCPPGMLQSDIGLPAEPADLPTGYPIEVPWDGILVEEKDHDKDIVALVLDALEVIHGKRHGAVEGEACAALGVSELRDYFRRFSTGKVKGFFEHHLDRYTKSKRKAPIFWPLSTKSGSYTLWLYYPRLTEQTLHTALADFVGPKLRRVKDKVRDLKDSNGSRTKLEELQDFETELTEMHAEIERIIRLGWKPNLNDGVLVTASPLWQLCRLGRWRNDLKACWEKVQTGDYDWAHLAHTLHPDQVRQKCKRDRSLAIAHGLESICDVEAPKAKRGKKAKAEFAEETPDFR